MNIASIFSSILTLDFIKGWRTIAAAVGLLVLTAVETNLGIDIPGFEPMDWGKTIVAVMAILGIRFANK